MKKLTSILIIAMAFIACQISAQQTGTDARLASLDSSLTTAHVANTATVTMFVKVANAWDVASIQLVETKVSGTVAGTAVLVGSNDGVNFVNVCRPSVAANTLQSRATDTLTSTNVTTNTKLWVWSNKADPMGNPTVCFPYKYIGIQKVGSGTMNSTIKGYAVFKHK